MYFALGLFFLVLTCMTGAEKYRFCDENNNLGLKREFGHLPDRLAAGYSKRVLKKGEPETFCLGGVWSKFLFRYTEMVNGKTVYAYHEVTYDMNGKGPQVIDYLRVYTRRWQQVANAILETNDPEEENGILRIKYLLDNCDCVMRVYDLNQVNVVGTARTVDCQGTDLSDTALLQIRQARSVRLPDCERGLNPGIFKFMTVKSILDVIHTRSPAADAPQLVGFTLLYGTCSDRVVLGQVVPVFCYVIQYNGQTVDTLLSKPYEDQMGMFKAKGFDYTKGFYIYPVSEPGRLKIKFLVDDCSCFVRLYSVPQSGAVTRRFDLAPCDTFEEPAPGLWQPPVDSVSKGEKPKSSCFGF